MKIIKIIPFTFLLLQINPIFAAQETVDNNKQASTNAGQEVHIDFKGDFVTTDEKALKNMTYGMADTIKDLYALSSEQKKEYLLEKGKESAIVHCDSLGEYIKECKVSMLIANKLVQQQPININKIYFKSVKDYMGWQDKKESYLDKNCAILNRNFYKDIDDLTDKLTQNPNLTTQDKQLILKKDKVTLPLYILEIEAERKTVAYNCLDSKWTDFLNYRPSETVLGGDCKIPNFARDLGSICSK